LKSFLRKHHNKAVCIVIILLAVLGANILAINHYVERIGAKYIYLGEAIPVLGDGGATDDK
jgi:uncharacterized membrane protein YwaF